MGWGGSLSSRRPALWLLLLERGRKMETRSCLEMWVRLLHRNVVWRIAILLLLLLSVQRGRIRITLGDVVLLRLLLGPIRRTQILEGKHGLLSSRTKRELCLDGLRLWVVLDMRGWVRVECVWM